MTHLTGALHVYGGDLLHAHGRSEWDQETLREQPLNPDCMRNLAETANRFAGNVGNLSFSPS
jgi:hypothetical protein